VVASRDLKTEKMSLYQLLDSSCYMKFAHNIYMEARSQGITEIFPSYAKELD
jgi:hypothetical protein